MIFMVWQITLNVLGHTGYEYHPRWLMDSWLGKFMNTPFSLVIGMSYTYLPFMVLPLYVVLEKLDFSLVEAARDLGCSEDADAFDKALEKIAKAPPPKSVEKRKAKKKR